MNTTTVRLIKLSNDLKKQGLDDASEDIEFLKEMLTNNIENQRPLYNAEPTKVPGTWTDPSGDLIKTSKD